jgi:hypothetical protein
VKGRPLARLALGLAWVSASLAGAEPLPGAPALAPELARRLEAARLEQEASRAPRTRHVTPEHLPRFTNRLILETSPYLLQHAHNPVNWYAWGEEALGAARELDRPIFLSIGYSTCHWCHVMEEESFEDLEVAELLNRHFVAIKVDREERPDLDGLYMAAVQSLTGRGGWPLTALLTPDGRPFYGGTYFPPRDGQRGHPLGLISLLRHIHERYAQDRASIHGSASRLSERLRESLDPPMAVGVPGADHIRRALAEYRRGFDPQHGGLRSRTKFPSRLPLTLLLRVHRRTGDPEPLRMAQQTLDAMQRGGIYDHVGGGFHRYTIEPSWTIPHFEKMLYDNALLASTYLEAYQLTREPRYAWVARDVLDYLAREMTAPQGTFYAATDADSEGEEGRFYVWTPQQLQAAVGAELTPLGGLWRERGGKLRRGFHRAAARPEHEGAHQPLRLDARGHRAGSRRNPRADAPGSRPAHSSSHGPQADRRLERAGGVSLCTRRFRAARARARRAGGPGGPNASRARAAEGKTRALPHGRRPVRDRDAG